jgi:hypothetical protein
MENKKAQVPETITWIVATVIIIVILAVSIFLLSIYTKSKDFGFFETTDTFASKSFFSYLLTKDAEGNTVYTQLKNQENLNEFNGNLGKRIFQDFYSKEYKAVWIGILGAGSFGQPSLSDNAYFSRSESTVTTGSKTLKTASEEINLNDDRFIKMIMTKFR